MGRILLPVLRRRGPDLNDAADVGGVFQGSQHDRDACVRVPDQIDGFGVEVPPHHIEIIHTLLNAPGEHRALGRRIRSPAIPEVVEDERASGREAFEIVDQMQAVRNQDDSGCHSPHDS